MPDIKESTNWISNFKEKRMLIVQNIVVDGIEPTDENIISAWCTMFPDDRDKINDSTIFEWVRKRVANNGIKACKIQLAAVRRKNERNLKSKAKYVGYGAKLVVSPNKNLATYNIFTKGKKYSGNYQKLCRRLGYIRTENKTKNERSNA